MSATINLTDIPDLSAVFDNENSGGSGAEAFQDGWYSGVIQEVRSFTDRNGNDRVFESTDAPSANGDSRNIKLQVELTRASDGRKLNTSWLVNYRPEALTQEVVQAIVAKQAAAKETGERAEWGELFGSYMTIQKLGKLQKVAGVRQFQKTDVGGLNLSSLYGKQAWFKLRPDSRNPQYKEISDVRPDKPTKAATF